MREIQLTISYKKDCLGFLASHFLNGEVDVTVNGIDGSNVVHTGFGLKATKAEVLAHLRAKHADAMVTDYVS